MGKLQRPLFYLLILFLPTQLTKHFWPDWAMVGGIRVDYLSPTVYLTDLLVVGLLILVAAERLGERKSLFKSLSAITFRGPIGRQNVRVILGLAGGLIFLSLGVVGSIRPLAGFYKLLKLVEFFLLGLWVKNNFVALLPCCLVPLLSLTIIYSSLIAWGQFLRQGSLGGLFWWLGERTFTSSTPGIAQVVLNGQLFLRPYATFSHPNVLGGYLATVIPLIITQISNVKSQNYSLNLIAILKMLAIFLGVATLFITFSRAAWLVGGIGIILSGLLPSFRKAKKESKKRSS
ncbi:MAG TPA: hypothetical protein EYP10_04810, partial [Armatimonadetes bacterium]|nr:hypothetical protein [Armatimonadota bacterium]